MIRLLLWQRFVTRKNEIMRGRLRKRIGWLAGMLLGAGFVYLVFEFNVLVLHGLVAFDPQVAPTVVAASLSVLGAFALFWGIGSVMSDLYLASDLELLLAAPVPRSAIFWLKLLGAMWENLVPCLLPATTLIAYGVVQQASWTYFVAAALALVFLLTFLAGASMALVMLVMRVMPAQRAREIYSLVYVIFFAVAWLGWMVFSGNERRAATQLTQLGPQIVSAGQKLVLPPASWAAHMMLAWIDANWRVVAINAVGIVALAGAAVVLAYGLFDATFHQGWAVMHEVGTTRRRAARRGESGRVPVAPGQVLAAWLPWPARVLAAKDWTIFPRDLRQLSRLIMPLVVSLFYVYQIGFASPLSRAFPGAAFWSSVAILPVVPLFFALALGTPAVGKEGANFELLRVAPISPSGLLWGKTWMSAVPTAIVSGLIALAVGALVGISALELAGLLIVVVLMSCLMSAVAVALGALVPNLRATDYRRAAGPLASYGTMFGSVVLWVAMLLTLGVASIHLSGNLNLLAGMAAGSPRTLRGMGALLSLLRSPLPVLVVGFIDLLVLGGLAVVWYFAARRVAAWQPTE